ncbi:hypothetical protein BGZ61DRAFT_467907 [Ilyonectria robusta]|uniref:uncharacterized protein n=1 Tax=Ilyonectria robusta TaxID=1079257 RepID=UPI001E8E8ED0|nr:uncharacterized protein BGZ61DRAFT_467907 [Ilyonectria robusta]KAH8654194.1 hypothetical protein BGZ61DRAFT_467907 [Ilyonectria robusta]
MPVSSAEDLENAIADVKNGVCLKAAAKKNGVQWGSKSPATPRCHGPGTRNRSTAQGHLGTSFFLLHL